MEDRSDERARVAPARASRLFLVVGLLVTAGVLVAPDPARGWATAGLSAAAAGAGVVALRRDPGRGSPAWFLVIGMALLVPAYVIWYPATVVWSLELEAPAISDVLFVTAYGAFLIALGRLIQRRTGHDRRIDVLDTLIVGAGLAVLAWLLLIGPSLDASMPWQARATAVLYTILNVLLLGGIVRLLVQGGIGRPGDRLLGAWVLVQLTAELGYTTMTLQGTFRLDHPMVALYPLSFTLFGAALLHPTTSVHASSPTTGHRPARGSQRFALVVPAALVAPAVLAVLGWRAGDIDIVIVAGLAASLFVLVLVRVWLLVVDVEDHRRIQDRLTDAIAEERRQSEANQALVASLRERQMLTDRLSRIQRKISTRAPLQEVLDTITQGAAELVRADIAGLRLLDEHDPEQLVLVSWTGIGADTAAQVRRIPVACGVGGHAVRTNALCIRDRYDAWDDTVAAFAGGNLHTAMATPVHLGDRPIGSLTVGTHAGGRSYSEAEQDALTRFAQHVSIALNDARSVRAMNEALEQAVHRAKHDELTGLPNRSGFYEQAELALRGAKRTGRGIAVLLLDLDRFKEINDTLGHRYGDRVLDAVGPRILPLLRDGDLLARLGGDEFCVLLPDVHDAAVALEVAERITAALQEPVAVDGTSLVVEASCGVTVAPDHGDTVDLLLQRADIAMYAAKRRHLGVAPYDDDLDENTPDRLALLGELRTAVADDELVLHYQPQVDLRTGVVTGAEALVRWQHPRRGLLAPGAFVPLAEECGAIHQLTSWVLDAALAQLHRWSTDPRSAIADDFTVAVNLSTQTLLDESFPTEVAGALERFGVPASRLVLEITETTLMADPERARRVLIALADRGVRFAIDDFGTGYSSLASLKDLPVQELKIDRSFVRCMHEEADAKIVRSMIDLGRTLGLRTVAEGVEDTATWSRLAELGCDRAQGYLLATPLAPRELEAWMRTAVATDPGVLEAQAG